MTFDLEKARASDEALPYPLDAKEIWISGKGQMHINPPNEPSIFFTLSDLCEFRNLFHGQAAEIERLRGEMENYGDDYVCQMKSKDARIQELEAENINLETLNEGLLENGNDLRSRAQTAEARIQKLDALLNEADQCRRSLLDQVMQVTKQRDKAEVRIQELEDALAEYQRLGKTIAGKVPCLTLHGDCGRCSAKMREVCGALEQIAGGKIGPDAKQHDHTAEFFRPNESPAKSWQITDERKAAILHCKRMLTFLKEDGAPCYDVEKITKDESVLVAMLEEAGQ